MRKTRLWVLVSTLALCGGLCAFACAPSTQSGSAAQSTESVVQETSDSAETSMSSGTLSAFDASDNSEHAAVGTDAMDSLEYRDALIAKAEANQATYAPRVDTYEDGTRIQRTPIGDGIFNTYFLKSDERGCHSCHDNLAQTVVNMPVSYYMQYESHMNLLGLNQRDVDVMECVSCHNSSGSACNLREMIHGTHSNVENISCNSCHLITEDGKYMMWDDERYTVYTGISTVDPAEGTFTYDQTTLTDGTMFITDWRHYDDDYYRAMAAKGVTATNITISDETLRNWEIVVDGMVGESRTFTMGELIDMGLSVTTVMTTECIENACNGSLIGNYQITGIPLSAIAELMDVDPEAEIISADFGQYYPIPSISYLDGLQPEDALIVYQIGGDNLELSEGYPVQFWAVGQDKSAAAFIKGVNHLQFTVADADLADSAGGDMQEYHDALYAAAVNIPNEITQPCIKVINTEDGQIVKAGKYTFEGYAYSAWDNIDYIEISMNKGAYWQRFDVSDTNKRCWVHWTFTMDFEPGSYVLYVRAVTEGDGNVPDEFDVNSDVGSNIDYTVSLYPDKVLLNVEE